MTDKDGKLQYIEVSKIAPNRHQPRKDWDSKTAIKALEELADSIDADGLIQPIVVRPVDDVEGKEYEIIAGERRFRAVSVVLGKPRIQALVRTTEDETSATQALVENIQREDLNPLEEAEAIHKMMKEQGWNQEQAGQKLGKSRVHVSNALRLLKLPEAAQDLIAQGSLTRHQAITVLSAPKEAQEKFAEDAAKHNWPVEQMKKKVAAMGAEKEEKSKEDKAPKTPAPSSNYIVHVQCENLKEAKALLSELEEEGFVCWNNKDYTEHLKAAEEAKNAEKAEKTEKVAPRRRVRKAS